jgi:hypothetical protein
VPITSRASANTIVDGKLIENLYFYCEVFNLLSTKLMFFFSFANIFCVKVLYTK